MKLKKIHFAGFKSFVDMTDLILPANIIGVVGPNGCGKSNVIDAIRWVMGESSAKTLRGDNMADVIFNGSSARKPVGKASVELLFDNSDGTAAGAYSKYAEISVKRTLIRDGQSDYYLNNVRCRRKDITDLFLGTGLGPRSYSIIEQGMVSKIVEAKPEELRNFIEEAAGISKYKERRRETENRIRHTRENLERVNDIRRELDTQLSKLEKQAVKARQYKDLSNQQKVIELETWSLEWKKVSDDLQAFNLDLAKFETNLEQQVSEQRGKESLIETLRLDQQKSQDSLNKIQGEYYRLSADISTLEQTINFSRENKLKLNQQYQQFEQDYQRLDEQISHDSLMLTETKEEYEIQKPLLEELEYNAEISKTSLQEQELKLQSWQDQWDIFIEQAKNPETEQNVQKARIQQLQARIENISEQLSRFKQEKETLSFQLEDIDTTALQLEYESMTNEAQNQALRLEDISNQIRHSRHQQVQSDKTLSSKRHLLHEFKGKLASLNELQKAAMGADDDILNAWLEKHQLSNYPRLAKLISVDALWEKAVDAVLSKKLTAICMPSLGDEIFAEVNHVLQNSLADVELDNNKSSLENLAIDVSIVETTVQVNRYQTTSKVNLPRLLEKVHSDIDLSVWLAGVYVASGFAQAASSRHLLAQHEFIVLPNGSTMGQNWLHIAEKKDAQSGMVAREKNIHELTQAYEQVEIDIAVYEKSLIDIRENIEDLESKRSQCQETLNDVKSKSSNLQERLKHEKNRFEELTRRQLELDETQKDSEVQRQLLEQQLYEANEKVELAEKLSEDFEQTRQSLLSHKEQIQQSLQSIRQSSENVQQKRYELKLICQDLLNKISSYERNLERNQEQVLEIKQRREDIVEQLEEVQMPDESQQNHLISLIEQKDSAEKELKVAKNDLNGYENELILQSKARQKAEHEAQIIREALEKKRLTRQEWIIKQRNLQYQIENSQSSSFDQAADDDNEMRQDSSVVVLENLESQNIDASINSDNSTNIVNDKSKVDADSEEVLSPQQILDNLDENATLTEWKSNLAQINRKINQLGNVNLLAIEEFEEQSQRKQYLDRQNEDLMAAMDTLEAAINKIDKETKDRFKITYDMLNDSFQKIFPQLFGGGSASLQLTDNDYLYAGVSVVARPPGKRNSTIHLLSGGEKALTAVSLLFSLFQLSPAPFCILDEVDAPLDDANVERYCRILKQMSSTTQLLFITHNKITMEIADILVGVTMQEPGVSKVVAVDVAEAVEMAS